MKIGQLGRAFALDAEKRSESDTLLPSEPLRVPTVDERVNLYLRAVHGSRDYTSKEIAEARGRMLEALAADLATRAGLTPSDDNEDFWISEPMEPPSVRDALTLALREGRRDLYNVEPRGLPSDLISVQHSLAWTEKAESFEQKSTPRWRDQRFWVGGAAVGVLAAALITVFGPMVWRNLQDHGYLVDPRRTVIAEVTRGQETGEAQSGPGSFKLPGEGPRIVDEVAGSRAKDSVSPASVRAPTETTLGNLAPQLVVVSAKPHQQGQPAPLGASLRSGAVQRSVVVTGLPAGSTLSAGRQVGDDGWRVEATDLNGVLVIPPRGFVGAMDLSIEVRLVDDTVVDRKQLHLEWASKVDP